MNSSSGRDINGDVYQSVSIIESTDGGFSDIGDMPNFSPDLIKALEMAAITANTVPEQRSAHQGKKGITEDVEDGEIDVDVAFIEKLFSEDQHNHHTAVSTSTITATSSHLSFNERKVEDLPVSLEILPVSNTADDTDSEAGLRTVTSTQSLSLLRESVIDEEVRHTRMIKKTELAKPTSMGIAKALKYFIALIGVLAPLAIMPFELKHRDEMNATEASHTDSNLGMALGIALLAVVLIGTMFGYRAGKKKSVTINEELVALTEKIEFYQKAVREQLAHIFYIFVGKTSPELEFLLRKSNNTEEDAICSTREIEDCINIIKKTLIVDSVDSLKGFFGKLTDHEVQLLIKELTLNFVRTSEHINTRAHGVRKYVNHAKLFLGHGCEGGASVYATGLTGVAAIDAIGYNIGSTAFTSLSFGLAGAGALTGVGVGYLERRYEGKYETQIQILSLKMNIIAEGLVHLNKVFREIMNIEHARLREENVELRKQLAQAQDFKEEAKESLSPFADTVAPCGHAFSVNPKLAQRMLTFIHSPLPDVNVRLIRVPEVKEQKNQENQANQAKRIMILGRRGS